MTRAVSACDAPVWRLFSDWCAAVDENPLPAAPLTLARFLAANPAGDGTQRRRVGLINAAHRENGFDPPGRADAVRELLDERRRRWRRARAAGAAAAIALLPETGWPTAVFARRDAMILSLGGAGLCGAQIADLRAADVREAEERPGTLRVQAGGQTVAVTVDEDVAGTTAMRIWRRWIAVRQVQNQLPATQWTRRLIEGHPVPPLRALPDRAILLTALDRWGAAPLPAVALGAEAVNRIIAGHLRGEPPQHAPLRRRRRAADQPMLPFPEDIPPEDPVLLDPGVVGRGLQARRRAAELLDGVGDELDEVEERAEKLLAGLLELLEDGT